MSIPFEINNLWHIGQAYMFWRTKLFSSRSNYEDSGDIQFLTLQNIRLMSYYIALINNTSAIYESRFKSGWNK